MRAIEASLIFFGYFRPAFFAKPFMLVGADVTHPAPGPEAENTPSIAAVRIFHFSNSESVKNKLADFFLHFFLFLFYYCVFILIRLEINFHQVAASQDIFGFQYNMKYRLQRSRQEMITELADMMKEHLESFIAKFNFPPENIFYFRDGVSEGQFQEVRLS